MSKKDCELCGGRARMFCESDEASLCWDCDEKVHAANFLVAKHSRTLLCHACSSPTPWKAAGLRLRQAFSICRGCADADGENRVGEGYSSRVGDEDGGGGNSGPPESESDEGECYSDSEDSSEEEEEEDDVEEEEEDDDEEEENQVVPWSDSCSNTPAAAAAPMASYSSRGESLSLSFSKRNREIAFESEDDDGCSSSECPDVNSQLSDGNSASSRSLLRSSKQRRPNNSGELLQSPEKVIEARHATPSSGTAAIVEKLRSYHQEIATEKRARHLRGS